MKKNVAIVKGRVLKYQVRRHPRARHKKITISREKGVVVTLPSREPLAGIQPMFDQWAEWLEEKVNAEGVWDGPVIRCFASGTMVLMYGEPRELVISPLPQGKTRPRIQAEEGRISMQLPAEEILDPGPTLKKFLTKQARIDLKNRVDHWADITGLRPSRVIVGERTTRWGSCSSQGTLSFCYRLIMAPPEVIDAIVVHELCHLKHPNHGAGFWALVESYLPRYKQTRAWLGEYSKDLHL